MGFNSGFKGLMYSHRSLGLPTGLLPSGLPTTTFYAPLLSPIPATCLLISFFSIWSPDWCWVRRRDLLQCSGTLSVSAPYSRTPSAYVRCSIWQTKFQTHKNSRQYYSSAYFKVYTKNTQQLYYNGQPLDICFEKKILIFRKTKRIPQINSADQTLHYLALNLWYI